MSGPLPLTLEGVGKSYGARAALSDVTFSVPAGALLVLLGASGAGKSTCLRLVAGLDAADAGRIAIGDRVCSDPRVVVPPERRGVGLVFQHLELFPHMTAAENVAFGLEGRPRGAAAAASPRVREVAGQVGLPADLLSRRPPTLSGGERQRVAIARALAPAPAVLLYDEPLANLDPARRAEIRRLLRDVRGRRETTVVYVTHDADEALEMGDLVVVLEAGRVVETGKPADVYRAPTSLAGARALGALSVVPLLVRDGPGGRRLETPLGAFDAPAGTPPDAALGCLRPEQVAIGAVGPDAVVLDAFPRASDWAFSARHEASGTVLLGRSTAAPEPGSRVRLVFTGTPVPLRAGGNAPLRAGGNGNGRHDAPATAAREERS